MTDAPTPVLTIPTIRKRENVELTKLSISIDDLVDDKSGSVF